MLKTAAMIFLAIVLCITMVASTDVTEVSTEETTPLVYNQLTILEKQTGLSLVSENIKNWFSPQT
jgi:hypothetical protein